MIEKNDYKKYYTKSMIQKINNKYSSILNLFEYDFNGCTSKNVFFYTYGLKF